MPNWCECDLTVSGPFKERIMFRDRVKTGDEKLSVEQEVANRIAGIDKEPNYFDANTLIPYPKQYKEADEEQRKWDKEHQGIPWTKETYQTRPRDGYNNGGYEWCVDNWGTKWGLCDVELTERPRSLFYSFQCAWSPPTPIIKEASKQYPNLKFKLDYFERGAAYSGTTIYKGGEETIIRENNNYCGHRGG